MILGLSMLLPVVSVQAANLISDINKQNEVFAGQQGADLKNSDPRIIVGQAIKIAVSVLGTLLTAWTVYGGFLILTSAGDEEKISKGKSVITNGAIGLTLILSAYAIATFVSKLWAQPATEFRQDPKPVIDTNLYKDPNAPEYQTS